LSIFNVTGNEEGEGEEGGEIPPATTTGEEPPAGDAGEEE
jgi:hypothetical protein